MPFNFFYYNISTWTLIKVWLKCPNAFLGHSVNLRFYLKRPVLSVFQQIHKLQQDVSSNAFWYFPEWLYTHSLLELESLNYLLFKPFCSRRRVLIGCRALHQQWHHELPVVITWPQKYSKYGWVMPPVYFSIRNTVQYPIRPIWAFWMNMISII